MRKYFLSLVMIFSMGIFFSSCSTSCLGGCSTASSCSKTSCCSKDANISDKESSKSCCSKKDKKEG